MITPPTPEQPNSSDQLPADDGLNDDDHLSCNEDYWSIIVERPQAQASINSPPKSNNYYLRELDELDNESGLAHLHMLLSKENETHPKLCSCCCVDLQPHLSDPNPHPHPHPDHLITSARQEALQRILALHSYHSFSAFTAVLSVNYLDRFLLGLHLWRDMPMKPWMLHLAALACLSLAAKVAETHVPLLLDLQVVEKSSFVFSPKSIQKMELLVLSLLEWKMNPVIPLSFLSYIIKSTSLPADHRRNMEFTALFEHFCISLLSDLRFVQYQPSTVAAAVALHVMKEMDFDFCKNKLCTLLDQFNKEKFEACYQLILQASSVSN